VFLKDELHSKEDHSLRRSGDLQNSISQCIFDHFRCPTSFLKFSTDEGSLSEPGYFHFGSDTTCYGRSTHNSNQVSRAASHDLFDEVGIERGSVCLPFNPTEVIDNLRLERYVGQRSGPELFKRLYYWLRPLSTFWLRKQIKQLHFRNWRDLNFPRWPVDTTVESLCENLLLLSLQAKNTDRVPFVWLWPNGARGCVTMTHDVDTDSGMDFCTELMDMDDSFGVKSAFQIVPEERYHASPSALQEMRNRGFEIGIQDLNHDGRLFDDKQEFLRRIAIVNQYGKLYGARGFRAAVLYRKPSWYEHLDFSFDMSIPNVAHLDPQRGGCCTITPYFIGNVLELPVTTTQDYTLFHLLREHSIDLWETQIELILKKNGLVSFIVHPDYIIEMEARRLYEALLQKLAKLRTDDSVWFALPCEIDNWWRNRSRMRIERHGQSWKIVGPGAQNARLAYAKNVNGRLVYELG